MFSCPLFSKQSFDVIFDLAKRYNFVPFRLFFIKKYFNGLHNIVFHTNLIDYNEVYIVNIDLQWCMIVLSSLVHVSGPCLFIIQNLPRKALKNQII